MSKRSIITILLTVTVVAVALPYILRKALIPELPSYGSLPSFSFSNELTQQITENHLNGKVTLLNFFFTSCGGPCPRLMADIAKVEREIANEELALLSISVDPKRDTPEVLAEYKTKFSPAKSNWQLATGSQEEIKIFSEQGLKLALGDDVNVHATKVILIDKSGQIRGMFNPNKEFAPLITAIRSLI